MILEEVCEWHAKQVSQLLGLTLSKYKETDEGIIQVFMDRYVGPKASYENFEASAWKPFFDSTLVVGTFTIPTADGKRLAYLRQCALDVSTGKVTYREHKY